MKRISLEQVINGERFFRVPKVLFELDFYKKMSSDSKLLYAILKDRFCFQSTTKLEVVYRFFILVITYTINSS